MYILFVFVIDIRLALRNYKNSTDHLTAGFVPILDVSLLFFLFLYSGISKQTNRKVEQKWHFTIFQLLPSFKCPLFLNNLHSFSLDFIIHAILTQQLHPANFSFYNYHINFFTLVVFFSFDWILLFCFLFLLGCHPASLGKTFIKKILGLFVLWTGTIFTFAQSPCTSPSL